MGDLAGEEENRSLIKFVEKVVLRHGLFSFFEC
jgi:hypothetical protein